MAEVLHYGEHTGRLSVQKQRGTRWNLVHLQLQTVYKRTSAVPADVRSLPSDSKGARGGVRYPHEHTQWPLGARSQCRT